MGIKIDLWMLHPALAEGTKIFYGMSFVGLLLRMAGMAHI
jgi:hypothetical protein